MDEYLNRAPCGYLSFTDAGLIVDINGTLLEILEYNPDQLIDQKFESILTISSRIFFQTHFFPLLRLHGVANEIFFTLRTKSKKDIPVLVNALREERAGRYISVCVLMVVTQRQLYENEILQAKRAAEEALRSNEELMQAKQELERHTQELDRKISKLEQANREHQRVSQILFHDLWEPLRKIVTFIDLLVQDGYISAPSSKELLLQRMRAAAERIGILLRSLQKFVAIDTMDKTIVHVDLNEIVAKAKGSVAREQADCEIISTNLPAVEGYPEQLVLLFGQLIDNSIKFCSPGLTPVIHIHADVLQQNVYRMTKGRYRYVDFVRILFKDNSRGFDNQYSNSVFNLLTKLEPETPGVGVGLAICQKIVENHFGSISAQSGIGQGVMVTILLPLQQQGFLNTPRVVES